MGMIVLALACFATIGDARRVRKGSLDATDGVRDWELDNIASRRAGEINDAELGIANLEQALADPALLSEVADWLRHPDGRSRLMKLLADPNFRQQAKDAADQMKEDGVAANFLRPEYYANQLPVTNPSDTHTVLSKAFDAAAAFHAPSAVKPQRASTKARASDASMIDFENFYQESKSSAALQDLIADAEDLNPKVKYWDPLKLAEQEFWGQTNEATIGFLRHAEIKHGRVAMAGFIGFCLHENGIHFPWKYPGLDWADYEKLSAPAIWDALPVEGRLQIVGVIGFFEWWGESSSVLEAEGQAHYMRGGKPGYYPTFAQNIHPVPLNLWDPFGFTKGLSEESKAKKLKAEINNGRLAMIGTMSLLAASRVPGSVPALEGLIKPYSGNVMIPFS